MKKKSTKKPDPKSSKKDKLKKIETKLELALSEVKGDFSEKKFKHLIKKSAKLFVTAKAHPKKAKKTKPSKKAAESKASAESTPTE